MGYMYALVFVCGLVGGASGMLVNLMSGNALLGIAACVVAFALTFVAALAALNASLKTMD